jgi:O-antigen/teichoic acid export membrane protein
MLVNLIVLLLAKAFDWGFQTYTLIYIISMLLFAIFAVWWMRRIAGGMNFLIDWKLIKAIFAFSIPMGLASSVGTLNGELDKLIIGKFFSTEEYAIFANASKTLPVTILATSLTAVLLPKFVRLLKEERYEEAVSIWGSSINISFCVMC